MYLVKHILEIIILRIGDFIYCGLNVDIDIHIKTVIQESETREARCGIESQLKLKKLSRQ